jgi:multidrug efflux pump subunit AcrA (membrane-fusion protein)
LFVRVTLVLGGAEDAVIVPEAALTRRAERDGLFVVDTEKQTVSFRPIEIGIRSRGRVQVHGEGIAGHVVTLGQQLLDDGSRIEAQAAPEPKAPANGKAASGQSQEG